MRSDASNLVDLPSGSGFCNSDVETSIATSKQGHWHTFAGLVGPWGSLRSEGGRVGGWSAMGSVLSMGAGIHWRTTWRRHGKVVCAMESVRRLQECFNHRLPVVGSVMLMCDSRRLTSCWSDRLSTTTTRLVKAKKPLLMPLATELGIEEEGLGGLRGYQLASHWKRLESRRVQGEGNALTESDLG